MDAYVMPALAALIPRRPALRVVLTIDLSDSLYQKVDRGDLDLVVAPTFLSQSLPLQHISVGKDFLRVVAKNSHPLRYKPTLDLADLAGYPWILPRPQAIARQRLASLFAESNLPPPNVSLEADFISKGCLDLIAATELLALAPASFIEAEKDRSVSTLPITMELPRDISLLTRRQAIWTPLMSEFQAVLEDVLDSKRKFPQPA
jgi:DNA-binding transcriptional LysR family regulator